VGSDLSSAKVLWSDISASSAKRRVEEGMCPEALTLLGLQWRKQKRFGMAVEKSGHAMFSAWRSWWASLRGSDFRGESMAMVRSRAYAQGEPRILRDTQRVTVTH